MPNDPKQRTCPECSRPFTSTQPTARTCSRACKTKAANLEATRGKQLYRLAYAWRHKGAKFSDLSWLMDQFIKEDKERGRQPPPMGRLDGLTTDQAFNTCRDKRDRVQENDH